MNCIGRDGTWPARIRGGASKDLLHKRGASRDTLKCSASEALNFMVALRAYLTLFVLPTCTDALGRSCRAWLALVAVIEKLQAVASAPAELQRLIVEQPELAKACRTEWWIPKCHLALHLPLQLSKHGFLQSCFVHERKHKHVKKAGNQILDTSKAFEKSILDDVLYGHLEALNNEAMLPNEGAQLLEPIRSAPRNLAQEIQRALETPLDVVTATRAVHGGNFAVSAQDLAVVNHEGQRLVGRVGYHVRVGTTCFSHVTFWKHVHGLMFRATEDEVALVETRHIRDTCSFSLQGDSAIVCMP
eukprot:s703_g2.t1